MPTRTEAIKRFLTAVTLPDLAALYTRSMECQVNVAQDGGQRIDQEYNGRSWQAWSDGLQKWNSFRIPYNAATNPEFKDNEMLYDLAEHADAIGMTGWDWEHRISKWVAYDFDAITGHSEKHAKKLSPEALRRVQDAASEVPWITVRRSTSGTGLHLYAFLNPVDTENHSEHAAVGRSLLGKLSALTGFDFESKVDICGGNMWVWGRKMRGTNGLTLIKSATELATVPSSWRDHIKVIVGRRRKTMPIPDLNKIADVDGVESDKSDAEKVFDDLTNQHPKIPLDEEHRKLLDYLLNDKGKVVKGGSYWDQDRHMLISHTLQLLEAHHDLSLRGVFKTGSRGSSSQNCFLVPLRRGAWAVRRYSLGVGEADTWSQDALGYTKCTLNQDPDLAEAARAEGGLEDDRGSFFFADLETAMKAARLLGVHNDITDRAPWAIRRKAWLKKHKDGRVLVSFEKNDNDQMPAGTGWLAKKDRWLRLFSVKTLSSSDSVVDAVGNYDDLVRCLTTDSGEDFGWVIKNEEGGWNVQPYQNVKVFLSAQGLNSKEASILLGRSVSRPWVIVNMPFREEYPGERKWNRNSAQFRHIPNPNLDGLNYPHWLKILNHCGGALDEAVKANVWCQANQLLTGGDYLKAWVASMFQCPLEPLPYLFFYGPQDSGKSIFHEALSLLMTKGYQRAESALISQSGFNGELEGAILCVIEEVNLSDTKQTAYNRIKDWVTARHIPIHFKGRTPYQVTNSTHWVQTGNSPTHCPIFSGDTRIVMAEVPSLDPTELIPKSELLRRLEAEAPDFLAAVLRIELPPPISRLNIPVLETEEKIAAARQSRDPIEVFFQDVVHYAPGVAVKYDELFDHFQSNTSPDEVVQWTKNKFGSRIPSQYVKGRYGKFGGQTYVGNVSLTPITEPSKVRFVARTDPNKLTWLIEVPLIDPDGKSGQEGTNGNHK